MKKRFISLLLAMCMTVGLCTGLSASAKELGMTDAVAIGAQPEPEEEQEPFKVYLSPSSQFANPYINGGNEEQYMRQVAVAMIPFLEERGIDYVLAKEKRAIPESDWGNILVLRAQEAYDTGCDLYLAIHSNATTADKAGTVSGTRIYYYTKNPESLRWAQITQRNFIYPDKSNILLATNDRLIDMHTPKMPSILVETAYHDNVSDANWIKSHIYEIAESLAISVAEYRDVVYAEQAGQDQTQNQTPEQPAATPDPGLSGLQTNVYGPIYGIKFSS